jgi:MSHA pilin protein MshB
MIKNKGFTLIELVVVIVILGILAVTVAPKYINLTDDALAAKVEANAGALRSGVQLGNMKWRALGSPTVFSQRDNIQLYGTDVSGQIDINLDGFPAQSYPGTDTVISTNNNDDCLSLWEALIEDGENKAALDDSKEFISNYEGNNTCSYKLTRKIEFGFIYDSTTGEVTLL